MWRRIKNFLFKNRSALTARERLRVVVSKDRNKQNSFLNDLRDEILRVCDMYIDVSNTVKMEVQLCEGRLTINGEIELAAPEEGGRGVNEQVN